MRLRPERGWPRLVGAYLLLVGLLALATTWVYLSAEAAYRPAVLRLSAAVLVAVALRHLLGTVRERIDAREPSAFELAGERTPSRPILAAPFVKLRDEVHAATRDQRYFERVLWDRIVNLAARQPGEPTPIPIERPSGRRLPRRGPSLAALREVIGAIEERS